MNADEVQFKICFGPQTYGHYVTLPRSRRTCGATISLVDAAACSRSKSNYEEANIFGGRA